VLKHLSETDRRLRLPTTSWPKRRVGRGDAPGRVAALAEEDYNLSLLGFSDEELQLALAGPEETNEGLTTRMRSRQSRRGSSGRRRRCGSWATTACCVRLDPDGRREKVLAGGLADMVSHPPYNVNYGATMKDTLRGTHRPIANDNLGAASKSSWAPSA